MRRTLLVALGALVLGAGAAAASADTVYLTNGSHLVGVATETADGVVVQMRSGKVWLTAAQVARIERRETPAQRFARERAVLAAERPGDLDARVALAERAREAGLTTEADAELRAVLDVDAGHPAARRALGFVLHEGAWVTPDERRRLMGFVRIDGEWLSAEEARARNERRLAEAEAARLEAERRLAEARADAVQAEAAAVREAPAEPVAVPVWSWPFAGTFGHHHGRVCDDVPRRVAPSIDPHTRRRLAAHDPRDPHTRRRLVARDPDDPHVRLRFPAAAADPHAAALLRLGGAPRCR